MTNKINLSKMAERQERLHQIGLELKSEFFGLDDIIDRVIDTIESWYVLPELISRPVIVNLWGLTGVGKTQLIRSLAKKLDINKKFIEVQMDGIASGSNYNTDSITKILEESHISEGDYGILLLDEFQRFRTIDSQGHDVEVKRFQDLWMLLSDGKFSVDIGKELETETVLSQMEFDEENRPNWWEGDVLTDKEKAEKRKFEEMAKNRRVKTHPHSVKIYKRILKLREPLRELITWPMAKFRGLLEEAAKQNTIQETDYSRLLIFICGNLDEAFSGVVGRLSDCDTDADIYHRETKKVSVIDIKNALRARFKPEQIARLGANHIIYPSLSKDAYTKLIRRTCAQYIDQIKENSSIDIKIAENAYRIIYDNSVYPTQGTRPVFSAVHSILSSSLTKITLWAVKNGFESITVDIDDKKDIIYSTRDGQEISIPIYLDIKAQRDKNSRDFNTMVAVHEAGHALVQALLTRRAPEEIKINIASFKGGFNMITNEDSSTQTDIMNHITVLLAGTVAEEIVFGANLRSSGNYHDIVQATSEASGYIRNYGFGNFVSHIAYPPANHRANFNTEDTNASIESLLVSCRSLASTLITQNLSLLRKIVSILLEKNMISAVEFVELAKEYIPDIKHGSSDVNYPYFESWVRFVEKHE